jgi:hypothetical protein
VPELFTESSASSKKVTPSLCVHVKCIGQLRCHLISQKCHKKRTNNIKKITQLKSALTLKHVEDMYGSTNSHSSRSQRFEKVKSITTRQCVRGVLLCALLCWLGSTLNQRFQVVTTWVSLLPSCQSPLISAGEFFCLQHACVQWTSCVLNLCSVAAANDAEMKLTAITWGYNNEYWFSKQADNWGEMGTWRSLGGFFAGGPTVIRNANNDIGASSSPPP